MNSYIPEERLDVIVTRVLHPERLCPPFHLARQKQLLAIPERNHLVSCPVDDENGTLDVSYSVYIREHVPRECEAEVERDSIHGE